jgi:nucleoside phosphorylase
MLRAVILTALSIEYLAVRDHLTDLCEERHPQGTIYERGKFIADAHIWDVGIAEIGAGNSGAAIESERALTHFNPHILLFVGVAGGIKDDTVIGDVVAATQVYGYESGKQDTHFLARPALGQSSYPLVQRAKVEARKTDWLKRLVNISSPPPRVLVAPIAAGEKVLASKQSELFMFISWTVQSY